METIGLIASHSTTDTGPVSEDNEVVFEGVSRTSVRGKDIVKDKLEDPCVGPKDEESCFSSTDKPSDEVVASDTDSSDASGARCGKILCSCLKVLIAV